MRSTIRAAVRWLARQARPGAVWITTHNALPAVWWYANDNLPALESTVEQDGQSCGSSELGETLRRDGPDASAGVSRLQP
jgi:hypothetical protein